MSDKALPVPSDVARSAAGDSSVCPGCGGGLRCGMVAGDSECWCYSMPHVIPVPVAANASTSSSAAKTSCLCPTCLQLLIDSQP
ncbi:MAG: cysteine-rich CWC family protein [Pseudomonadota bacterium]